jgi:hypothetical protein
VHDLGQHGVGTERRLHCHVVVPALGDPGGQVVADVVARGQERRHHDGRLDRARQHLCGIRSEDVDERCCYRPDPGRDSTP